MTPGNLAILGRAAGGPAYEPSDADLRDARLAGLALPRRATMALLAATALILLDVTRALVTPELLGLPADADGLARAVQRFGLFLLVPLAVVVGAFRDDPRRYGLTLGDWRSGAGLLAVGVVVMTPIILGLATLPDFRAYYGRPAGSLPEVVGAYALELVSAEFVLRGFLLFALLRRIGPLAVIVVQVPFIFAHIGKPELELWSTFFGGTVFAWLNWRTGSIAWSSLGHLYILVLMLLAAGGVTG
ncbi:MAG TPA: CPBP family intramembrane glutamic endopeptidase [Candidatus Deferrimicrobiaceae bacterium]|nr:CPBP family intramembrane glutamic endopeptidase [Candidatus Deferrimicrobiaceae bacterium]